MSKVRDWMPKSLLKLKSSIYQTSQAYGELTNILSLVIDYRHLLQILIIEKRI